MKNVAILSKEGITFLVSKEDSLLHRIEAPTRVQMLWDVRTSGHLGIRIFEYPTPSPNREMILKESGPPAQWFVWCRKLMLAYEDAYQETVFGKEYSLSFSMRKDSEVIYFRIEGNAVKEEYRRPDSEEDSGENF